MKSIIVIFLGLSVAGSAAASEGMPRAQWLANLRSGVGPFLCAPQSPLMRAYKEPVNTCPYTVEALFDKCTTSVSEVVIPEYLTPVDQANRQSQIIAECISAHYMGGAALEAFMFLQKPNSEKKPGG